MASTALSLFCTVASVRAEGQEGTHFEHLSMDDGLSQLSVISILRDSQGYMWFGTRCGLNRYDGRAFDVFTADPEDGTSLSDNIVNCIAEDRQGGIWVGTMNGLNRFDGITRRFSRFYVSGKAGYDPSEEIRALCADRENGDLYFGSTSGLYKIREGGREIRPVESVRERVDGLCDTGTHLWVCTSTSIQVLEKSTSRVRRLEHSVRRADDGKDSRKAVFRDSEGKVWTDDAAGALVCYHPQTFSIECSVPVPHEIRCLSEDARGHLVVGTRNGIFDYDRTDGRLTAYEDILPLQPDLRRSSIESLLLDETGILWVGTYSSGIYLSNTLGRRFHLHQPWTDPDMAQISLGAIVQDGATLWIGTDGAGLLRYDIPSGTFRRVSDPGSSKDVDNADNNIKCLLLDGKRLYIGLYSGWLQVIDTRSERLLGRYHLDDYRPICAMCRYDGSRLLLGTYSKQALKLFDTRSMQISDFPGPGAGDDGINRITALLRDGDRIYVGTKQNGLYILQRNQRQHLRMDGSFGGFGRMVSTLSKDPSGNILVGTADEGLNVFSPDTGLFRNIRRRDGLPDDKVCSVLEDTSGSSWVVTLGGLSELDRDYSVRRSFDRQGGIGIQEFSVLSGLCTEEGTFFVGGNNGMVSFRPEDLRENDRIPPVTIKNVWVNTRLVPVDLRHHPSIRVKHNEAYIRIECNVLNYLYPEQNQFAFMLEGAEKDWTYMGNASSVNYAHLSPGRYTFRVKGANNDGYWNEEGAWLGIRVLPPFYLSGWAFLAYLLLFAGILGTVLLLRHTRMNLSRQIALKKQDEELFQAKIDFFTDVSHEFRTPLTLIRGPIEEVISSNDTGRMDMHAFKMVHDNVNRMLMLIEQLMTFRKMERGNMVVKASKGDFNALARQTAEAFATHARQKGIRFSFRDNGVPENLWFDPGLMERLLMNLLSNAFKYTPAGGSVSVLLATVRKQDLPHLKGKGIPSGLYPDAGKYLRIDIRDSGDGIPPGDLERIFEPFVQGSNSSGGTGIGLSLCKNIAAMHHGIIWAGSDGNGSCFSVIIPDGRKHFRPEETEGEIPEGKETALTDFQEEAVEVPASGLPATLLIVEDNKELRRYMARRLRSRYKVLEAANGKEGYALALSAMPALILSDIMMPEMDGLQFCRSVKGDSRTSHIPVILLTARSYALQVKEGLESGADDYITKPFSMDDLLAKVANVLRSRENLKNLYAKGLSLENMGMEILSSDEKFLQKLNEVIQERIADPKLDVREFCSRLGMSRASLYRKIEAATQMSPSKYIQHIRLHLAARLLKGTRRSVTEIMYAVGFVSPSHFSTAFRKRYGMSPTRFRRHGPETPETGPG